MRRSDDYRSFAAECLRIGQAAEDVQQRAVFMQMARTWLALAQNVESNSDSAPNLNEESRSKSEAKDGEVAEK